MENQQLDLYLLQALSEDIGDGDHSSLAVIPENASGQAVLLAKDRGILAGLRIIRRLFELTDPKLQVTCKLDDGAALQAGDEVLVLEGPIRSLLKVERLALNILQRMSGIATQTHAFVSQVSGTKARILDTRKTTPNSRILEKEAVRLGGGVNHRFGLYDMIMLKDNHIDFAGGIQPAIRMVRKYLNENKLLLPVEIEVRNLTELEEVLQEGGADRVMLDNFSVALTQEAVSLINGRIETESSGKITLDNVRDYALTGVDYISIGSLTHKIISLDMSLKAISKSE